MLNPIVTTPKINYSFSSPRNAILNQSVRNDVSEVICQIDPCHPLRGGVLAKTNLSFASVTSLLPLPSVCENLLFCTAPQSFFLFLDWMLPNPLNHWINPIRFLKYTQLNFVFKQVWWQWWDPKETSDDFMDEKHRHWYCEPFEFCVFPRAIGKLLLVLSSFLFVLSSQSNWLPSPRLGGSAWAARQFHLEPESLALG